MSELRKAFANDMMVVDGVDDEVVVLGLGVGCEEVMKSCHDVSKALGFGNYIHFLGTAQASRGLGRDSAIVKNLCCAGQ
jgi:hypothetical protein